MSSSTIRPAYPLDRMPRDLRRVALTALAVSLIGAMTSNMLFLAAFRFRIDWFQEPVRMIAGGPSSAELLRWAALLDMLGYYLATGVLAYALWRYLRPREPAVADLSLLAVLGYTLAGGAAASVLAMAGPMLIHAYAAAPADAPVLERQFAVLLEWVLHGVWQLFDGILLGAWWVGLAVLLRPIHPRIAALTGVLAALALVGVAFNVLGLGLLRDGVLGLVFVLWTAWWIVLLVVVAIRPGRTSEAPPRT